MRWRAATAGWCAALARAWVAVLVVYAVLMAFAGWFVQRLPTGFIPSLDRGDPDHLAAASAGRLAGAHRRGRAAGDRAWCWRRPASSTPTRFTGRNGATFTIATNAGADVPRARRFRGAPPAGPDHRQDRPGRARQAGADRGGAGASCSSRRRCAAWARRPASRCGCRIRVGMDPAEFARIAQEFVAEANRTPGIANVFTTFQAATPQVFVDVDRDKAQMLKVPVTSIFEAMRVFMGSAYVNDFNMFGRTYRVTAQADGDFRLDAGERVAASACATTEGQMVPLGSLVTFKEIAGPERVPRYNLFPTAEVNGAARPGVSSGQALEIMRELAREKLPAGRHLRVDRSVLPGGQGRPHRLLHLRAQRDLRVPGAGGAVRELVAAARHHADRAHVPVLGRVRRVAARARDQHPHPDRLRRADRAGGQERDPDRGVRAPAGGAGRWTACRRRSRPASCGCGRS